MCEIYVEALEYLRSFLLGYPDHRIKDIDSKVTLFVFATNQEVERKWKGENKTYERFFDNMASAKCARIDCCNLFNIAVWVFMGPVHILMIYSNTGGGLIIHAPFKMTDADLNEARQQCIIKSTETKFSIKSKQERFFPLSAYDMIVSFGNDAISRTAPIKSKESVDLTLPPIPATTVLLLPKSVAYDSTGFKIPDCFQTTFTHETKDVPERIVGAVRGKSEKIVFVCLERVVKYVERGNKKYGPLVMALNVDDNGKISYLKDVQPITKEKCNLDLSEIPYKQLIEDKIEMLIQKGIATW
jgi:hypothetical protein